MLEGNPWRQLPEAPPFVLPEDDKVLRRYPKLRENLRLDFLPVPFHGSDRADILLLSLNPGARINTLEDDETFVKERRPGLLFESTSLFPFSCLNPAFSNTAGYDYWNRRLGSLIERVGREVVAQRVLLVEYFPYRSSTWRPVPELRLPPTRHPLPPGPGRRPGAGGGSRPRLPLLAERLRPRGAAHPGPPPSAPLRPADVQRPPGLAGVPDPPARGDGGLPDLSRP